MLGKCTKLLGALTVFLGLILCSFASQEQNPPSGTAATETAQTDKEMKHHGTGGGKVTVTGCLQKGTEANEYQITGEDGKKYGLKAGGKTDLAAHVGHKVTVTGREMKESTTEKAKEGETADLRVTSLKHVSNTCP